MSYGSERNRMLQGNVQPIMVQGAISGKGITDLDLIKQFMANDANPRSKPFCYPGGGNFINHNIMQYDTVIGMRNVRELEGFDGEPAELAICGLGGLNWQNYCSQRQMEDDFYWIGVVTTESRLYNPSDPSTADAIEQGFGFIRCGTITVQNNGGGNFYPGDGVAYRFPQAPFFLPEGNRDQWPSENPLNTTARAGRPNTQFQVEYVRFNPLDLTAQQAAAFSAIVTPAAQGGVSDFDYRAAVPSLTGFPGQRPHDGIQEEAISYKFGISAAGLSFVETLLRHGVLQLAGGINNAADVRRVFLANNNNAAFTGAATIAEGLGLWETANDTNQQAPIRECLADVMMYGIAAIEQEGINARTRFETASGLVASQIAARTPSTEREKYGSLRVHAMDLLLQGICGSFDSAQSRKVGRALNASAPNDDLHTLLGHFC
jgi:hypothetical protein